MLSTGHNSPPATLLPDPLPSFGWRFTPRPLASGDLSNSFPFAAPFRCMLVGSLMTKRGPARLFVSFPRLIPSLEPLRERIPLLPE